VKRTKLERSASRANVLSLSQAELPGCGAGSGPPHSDAPLLGGREGGVKASLEVPLPLENRFGSGASEENPGPEMLYHKRKA
jgi:hypothetical protein